MGSLPALQTIEITGPLGAYGRETVRRSEDRARSRERARPRGVTDRLIFARALRTSFALATKDPLVQCPIVKLRSGLRGTKARHERAVSSDALVTRVSPLLDVAPGEDVFLDEPYAPLHVAWRIYTTYRVWRDDELIADEAPPSLALVALERGFNGGCEFRLGVLRSVVASWRDLDVHQYWLPLQSRAKYLEHRAAPSPSGGGLLRRVRLNDVVLDRYGLLLAAVGLDVAGEIRPESLLALRPPSLDVVHRVARVTATRSGLDPSRVADSLAAMTMPEQLGLLGFSLQAWYRFFRLFNVSPMELELGLE